MTIFELLNNCKCICCFIDIKKMCSSDNPIISYLDNCCRCALNNSTDTEYECAMGYFVIFPCECVFNSCISVGCCACNSLCCCCVCNNSPCCGVNTYMSKSINTMSALFAEYNCCFINCLNLHECILTNTQSKKIINKHECCNIALCCATRKH